MRKYPSWKKAATAITVFLLVLCLASLLALLLPPKRNVSYIADVFQNGNLIMSIPLDDTAESRTFTVTGENGCVNEIQIRSDSIGIISADCPDKLCVGQGFIRTSGLPITCLPNRLVIQLRPSEDSDDNSGDPFTVPDAVSY